MNDLLSASRLSLQGRLHDVAIALREGELACLVGPNGSGKTSLLHALSGIGRPAGAVKIGDIDARAAPPELRANLFSFLPASREIKWPLSARDLVALGGAAPAAIEETMAELELEDVADHRVDRLSTGERSRVLLARALAPDPQVLFLDEPTANLDPLWQIRLMDMLKARLRQPARAALVAIHDLDAAARYGDRMIVMDGGRIAADGPPRDILGSRHLAEIFGIERIGDEWRPAVRPREDRRSSP